MTNLQLEIKLYFLEQGASLLGFADISDLPQTYRHHFTKAISIGVTVRHSAIHSLNEGPTPAYEAEHQRITHYLEVITHKGVDYLRRHQVDSQAIPTCLSQDSSPEQGYIPHKTIAMRAGLGWIGKSQLLITRQFGAAVRFNTILCNGDFNVAFPCQQSRCDQCVACIESCPGKALRLPHGSVSAEREDIYNTIACREIANRLSRMQGIDIPLCGTCMYVCPWTQRYLERNRQDQRVSGKIK